MAVKIGSKCSDVLTGTDGNDIIIARAGNDVIEGGAGDDWIFGGAGSDIIYGGAGDDSLFGGAGEDFLYGEEGNDNLVGGAGNDVLEGGTGDDVMLGNQGDDTFYMGTGADKAYGGAGNDTFHYSVSDNLNSSDIDYIRGGGGSDTLILHLTKAEETLYRDAIEEALSTHKPWLPFDFAPVTDGAINLKILGVENLVFEVKGNETPVAMDDSFELDEDGTLEIMPDELVNNDTDPDGMLNSDSIVVMAAPEHGSLVVDTSNGKITYTPDADYNGVDSFTYTVEDNEGATSNVATVNIVVNAVNDAPVASDQAASAVEDAGVVSGMVVASDVDGDLNPIGYALISGVSEGTLVFNNDGSYTFDVGSNFQDLGAGETRDVTFTYTASDLNGVLSAPATVTISVTGVNDLPVISGINNGVVTEDGVQTASGSLIVTDPDLSDAPAFVELTQSSGYGSFSIDALGNWSYNLDNAAAQGLGAGESVQEVFTVEAVSGSDSVNYQVAITVNGTNDVPVISGVNSGAVAEDGTQIASGSLTVTDLDISDVPNFVAVSGLPGSYGSLDLDAAGNWTYTLDNNAAQGLGGFDTVQEAFTVQAISGSDIVNYQITIDVSGANDLPVITGTDTGSMTEDGTEITGSLDVTDADSSDLPLFTPVVDQIGDYGTFNLDANGNWSYAVNSADVQSLDSGQSVQDSFTVHAGSGNDLVSHQVVVTIAGENDAPIVNDATFNVDENSADGTVVGQVVAFDPEANISEYAITDGNSTGIFAIDNNGQITVADGSQLDYEATNQHVLTVQATDAGGAFDTATVTVDLNDVAEGPVPSLSIDDISTVEPSTDAGYTLVQFTVALSDPATTPVTVDYYTENGTAIGYSVATEEDPTDPGSGGEVIIVDPDEIGDGTTVNLPPWTDDPGGTAGLPAPSVVPDFSHVSGTLTFEPGVTSQTITVAILADAVPNLEIAPETFAMHLTNASGADIGDNLGICTIYQPEFTFPQVEDGSFELDENSANGTVVGTVVASDLNPDDTLTFSIQSGNESGAFAIDPITGEITVANSSMLDFETTQQFVLNVQATDNGGLTGSGQVIIALNDIEPEIVDGGGDGGDDGDDTEIPDIGGGDDGYDPTTDDTTGGDTGGGDIVSGGDGDDPIISPAIEIVDPDDLGGGGTI